MLLSDGISEVRAFGQSNGVSGDGQPNQLTGFAIVKWYSIYNDMQHQVYVNGKFAGVTVDCLQRQMVVPLPVSQEAAVKIEVFATDSANEIEESILENNRIRIQFPKTDHLPIEGTVDFYLEDEKLNKEEIKIHSVFCDKGGFGLACFELSDFGFDGSSTIGLGKGNFGCGQFGYDADLMSWQSKQLKAGKYQFNIKITDKIGNQQITQTETIPIIAPAKPAYKVTVDSFDKQSGKLIISAI